MKTPFEYSSPEAMSAEDIIDLFVPVFGEYMNVPNVGHTFINGPRGSGKSMIFRYMSPDCQTIAKKEKVKDLDYFGIHIPIKEGHLDKTDLELLNGLSSEIILNEHYMVINFAIKIFEKLEGTPFEENEENFNSAQKYYKDTFERLLALENWKIDSSLNSLQSYKGLFKIMKETCLEINRCFNKEVIRKLYLFNNSNLEYSGPIFSFSGFLMKLLEDLKTLPFMPSGPIFLLIDDADNLNETQTKILNTWVSTRTSKTVSFKISTQLRYKTFKTVNGSRIDTPHDYSEINISDIYTSRKGLYRDRVNEAVQRRLKKFGLQNINAEEFFPVDEEQEKAIQERFDKYQKKEGYDFAYRYARPDFMKDLKGNLNTYSYAGFKNLVNISSGVMRHFIEFAHRMYTHQYSKYNKNVSKIEPSIQDEQIKEYSSWFFHENFTKLRDDNENSTEETDDFVKLRNLLEALGQTFHLILFSPATERRVFSFALQNEPNSELRKILKLGVETGYLQSSLIGNKMGTGKAELYILNRLLAPYFKLDPTSFAGYKFVTCEILNEAMLKPNTIVGRIKSKGIDVVLDDPQQSLFKDEDYGYY